MSNRKFDITSGSSHLWRKYLLNKPIHLVNPITGQRLELGGKDNPLDIFYQALPDEKKPAWIVTLERMAARKGHQTFGAQNLFEVKKVVEGLARTKAAILKEHSSIDVNRQFQFLGKRLQELGHLPADLRFGFVNPKVTGVHDPALLAPEALDLLTQGVKPQDWPEDVLRKVVLHRFPDGSIRAVIHVAEGGIYVIDTDGDALPMLFSYRETEGGIEPIAGISMKHPITRRNRFISLSSDMDYQSTISSLTVPDINNYQGQNLLLEQLRAAKKRETTRLQARQKLPGAVSVLKEQVMESVADSEIGLLTNKFFAKEIREALQELRKVNPKAFDDPNAVDKISDFIRRRLIGRERFPVLELGTLKKLGLNGKQIEDLNKSTVEEFNLKLPRFVEMLTVSQKKLGSLSATDFLLRSEELIDQMGRRGLNVLENGFYNLLGTVRLEDFVKGKGKFLPRGIDVVRPKPIEGNRLFDILEEMGLLEEKVVGGIDFAPGLKGIAKNPSMFVLKGITGDLISDSGLQGDVFGGHILGNVLRKEDDQTLSHLGPRDIMREHINQVDTGFSYQHHGVAHSLRFGEAAGIFDSSLAVGDRDLLERMATILVEKDMDKKLFPTLSSTRGNKMERIRRLVTVLKDEAARRGAGWLKVVRVYQAVDENISSTILKGVRAQYNTANSLFGSQVSTRLDQYGRPTLTNPQKNVLGQLIHLDVGNTYEAGSFGEEAYSLFEMADDLMAGRTGMQRGLTPYLRTTESGQRRVVRGLMEPSGMGTAVQKEKNLLKLFTQELTATEEFQGSIGFFGVDELSAINKINKDLGRPLIDETYLKRMYEAEGQLIGPGQGVAFSGKSWEAKLGAAKLATARLGATFTGVPTNEEIARLGLVQSTPYIDAQGVLRPGKWHVDPSRLDLEDLSPKALLGGAIKIQPNRIDLSGVDLAVSMDEVAKRDFLAVTMAKQGFNEGEIDNVIRHLEGGGNAADYLTSQYSEYWKWKEVEMNGQKVKMLAAEKINLFASNLPVENIKNTLTSDLNKPTLSQGAFLQSDQQAMETYFTKLVRDLGGEVSEDEMSTLIRESQRMLLYESGAPERLSAVNSILDTLSPILNLRQNSVPGTNTAEAVQEVMGRMAANAEALGGNIMGKTAGHLNVSRFLPTAGAIVGAGLIFNQINQRHRPHGRRKRGP